MSCFGQVRTPATEQVGACEAPGGIEYCIVRSAFGSVLIILLLFGSSGAARVNSR